MDSLQKLVNEVELLSDISSREYPITPETRKRWKNLTGLIEEVRKEFYVEDLPLCEVQGCMNFAEYEGWYRVKDCSGNLTGLNRKGNVCEEHKMLLIGFQNKENKDEVQS